MIEWIDIDSPKIKKIAYNAEIKTMYIDFQGSTIDTPFKGVSEETFKIFSEVSNIDEYYELYIKDKYQKVELDTTNVINCRL